MNGDSLQKIEAPQPQVENIQRNNQESVSMRDISQQPAKDNTSKLEMQMQSINQLPKLKREDTQKGEKKKEVKKPKMPVIDFSLYIPEFLLLISQQKSKAIIRIGKNYQAEVPKKCAFSNKYQPLGHLKLWSPGEFNNSTFKKFRQKFGQNRTQQDLCLLFYQYQCNWDDINNYMLQYKVELRKAFLQKDRTKP